MFSKAAFRLYAGLLMLAAGIILLGLSILVS